MQKNSKTQSVLLRLLLKITAMPGYCLWLFHWLAVGLVGLMLVADFLHRNIGGAYSTQSEQAVHFSLVANSTADGVIFIAVSLIFWYFASRISHRFINLLARSQLKRIQAIKFGGLLSGSLIILAFLVVQGVSKAAVLLICAVTLFGCCSFWVEKSLAHRWKLQNEL